MRSWGWILTCVLGVGALGCASGDAGGGVGGGDAAVNATDADPNAPDADPNAPDADPNAPDADPNAPDAGGGSCTGDLVSCSGSCVDLLTDDAHCGQCGESCDADEVCLIGNCVPGVGTLVLSEVRARRPSYFELYNGGADALDLQGYRIQWDADGVTGALVLPSVTIAAGEFLVLREGSGASEPGAVWLGDPVTWAEGIAVRLLDPAGLGLDFVRTGAAAAPPPTGTAWTGVNALNPSVAIDQSLVRNVYVPDTDAAADWSLRGPSSPGDFCGMPGRCGDRCYDFAADRDNCGGCGIACTGATLCLDGECRSGFPALWISEYRTNGRPAVELHNPTATAIQLEGMRLALAGSQTLSFVLPPRMLAPGGFLAIYMGDGEDDATSVFTGPSGAFGPSVAITLFDNDGTTPIDHVRFGATDEPVPSGVSWFGDNVTAALAAHDGYDRSLRRNLEVFDSDSAADWSIATPATPGFSCHAGLASCDGVCRDLASDPRSCGGCGVVCGPHETCASGLCTSPGGLVLSELINIGSESFELFNGTDQPIDLAGYRLQWVADGGSNDYTIADATIHPGKSIAFHESTGTSTTTAHYMGTSITWSSFIAVALLDPSGSGVDFVRTTGAVTPAPAGTSWTGGDAPNPSNVEYESLLRVPHAPDTDDAADWAVGPRSPGDVCVTAAEEICGSTCVDPSRDPMNCGRCGNVCASGQACHAGKCIESGAIRMVAISGTNGARTGAPQVYWNSKWYAILSGNFDSPDADVVCRQRGYTSGTYGGSYSNVGCVGGCGYKNSFGCTGDETRLLDCPHTTSSSYSSYGVRVDCSAD